MSDFLDMMEGLGYDDASYDSVMDMERQFADDARTEDEIDKLLDEFVAEPYCSTEDKIHEYMMMMYLKSEMSFESIIRWFFMNKKMVKALRMYVDIFEIDPDYPEDSMSDADVEEFYIKETAKELQGWLDNAMSVERK